MADTVGASLPSRYHSQRRKQALNDAVPAAEQTPSPPTENAVTRSKSRYRRKQNSSVESPPETAAAEPDQQTPAVPSRYHSKHRPSLGNPTHGEHATQEQHPLPRTSAPVRREERQDSASGKPNAQDLDKTASTRPSPAVAGRQVQPDHTRDDNDRRKVTAIQSSLPLPPLPPPPPVPQTGGLFPPLTPTHPPPRMDGPPQSGNIRATKSMSELPVFESEGEGGCLGGLFKRKKDGPGPEKEHVSRPMTSKGNAATLKSNNPTGIDAPVSAINAGDRHVQVECGRSKAMFPVTPTTTSADLIKSAATCMSERINVKSAVMLEYFSTVGVQRPLRRYEHVRDVMNSWNNDEENSLLIADPGTGTVESELTLTGAPREPLPEQTWLFQYSQKVGTWNKRWITLRENGQIVGQKEPDKPEGIFNLCHLSDFDIYTPSPEKLKKKIKPPKRICFAIKSQQKTSLFESTHNFVHFFSTGDRRTGEAFYHGVHAWRSWYLVNVLGEGEKQKPQPTPGESKPRNSTSNDQSRQHRVKESMDSQYQLGSFKPLIDLDNFTPSQDSRRSIEGRRISSAGGAKTESQDPSATQQRRVASARKQHPPLSLNNKTQLAEDEPLANLNRGGSLSKRRPSTEKHRPPEAAEFSESGLLGRSYSQKRKEAADREASRQEEFLAGPNLAQGGDTSGDHMTRRASTRRQGHANEGPQRSRSVRDSGTNDTSNRNNSEDLDRSVSRRQKPKPLIDLTPQPKELVQAASKGRGYRPERVGEGGLIESATSLEDPLGLPQNNIMRTANSMPMGRKRTGSASDNQMRHPSSTRQAPEGFTGDGLLAHDQNRQGWGGADRGRGVIDGSRAGGRPLVDLGQDSRFVAGSLLNQVERAEGGPMPAPVIDREKRHERVEKYGEGF